MILIFRAHTPKRDVLETYRKYDLGTPRGPGGPGCSWPLTGVNGVGFGFFYCLHFATWYNLTLLGVIRITVNWLVGHYLFKKKHGGHPKVMFGGGFCLVGA